MQRASDFMQTHVITVKTSDSLEKVEQLFVDEEIHGAPVVDVDGSVVGVISASDLLRDRGLELALADPALGDFATGIARDCVSDAMTFGVVRVLPNAPVTEVARVMRERGVHRVLVMQGERVLGLISAIDLLQALRDRSRDRA